MAMDGDFAKLGRLAVALEGLGDQIAEVAKEACEDLAHVVEAQFDAGHDPWGNAWAPLRPSTLRRHGPPPLTYTHDMRDSLKVEPLANTISFTMDGPAIFHQRGSGGMHRQILPEQADGRLPQAYEQVVHDAADRVIGKALKDIAA